MGNDGTEVSRTHLTLLYHQPEHVHRSRVLPMGVWGRIRSAGLFAVLDDAITRV